MPDRVWEFITYRNEPDFMLRGPQMHPLGHLGDQIQRLNYVKILLRNTVLHIDSVEQWSRLYKWLEAVDFAPLGLEILDSGFDAVHHLSFRDLLNLTDEYLPIPREAYEPDGTTPTDFIRYLRSHYYNDMLSWKLVWNDCVALTRLCKDLRTVELRARLPGSLMVRLHTEDSMAAVLGTADIEGDPSERRFDGYDAHQILRLLDLQNLKVLDVLFYASSFESDKLSEDKVRMIASWLEDRFAARRQTVKVQAKFELWRNADW